MALRSLGSVPAAEEAAQETLARAVEALQSGQLRDPERVAAFVSGIARHVIADACRARKRDVPLEGLPEAAAVAGTGDALAALISTAEQGAVRTALARLSAGDRELLRLAFFEGLEPAEIAARLGEPAERIRKRKSRALERLRAAFLGATGGHEPEGSPT
jgi:RNA polymerase sigma-70 factor, ECF subfamily